MRRQVDDQLVVQPPPLGGQHDQQPVLMAVRHRPIGRPAIRQHRLDTVEDGLATHQHSRTAAERAIIDFLMLIGAIVADVPEPNVDQPPLDRQFEQALLEIAVENPRKERQNVETHCSSISNKLFRGTGSPVALWVPRPRLCVGVSSNVKRIRTPTQSRGRGTRPQPSVASAGASLASAAAAALAGRALGANIGGGAAASPNRFVRTFLIRAATLTLG
jgi:hypothetical protein